MASRSTERARADTRAAARGSRQRAGAGAAGRAPGLDAEQAAWLALVPAALVTALAILALGPGLGSILYPAHHYRFYDAWIAAGQIRPEPTEQARFLISLAGPILLAAATILLVLRPPRLGAGLTAALVGVAQLIGIAFLAVCFVAQQTYAFGALYTSVHTAAHTVYFRIPTLIVAAVIAALVTAGTRSERVRTRFVAWTAETRWSRVAGIALAVALTVVTVLPAINTDSSVLSFNPPAAFHLQFTFDEAMAVLDGRTPIGNFAAQYGSLWPYVTASAMGIFGSKLLVFTIAMATITGLSLLGVFSLLRRLTHAALPALLLFLPLLATSAYIARGPFENRYSMMTYFGTFPLRYAGPLLLCWFTARHLDGARPRRAWPLFLAGGLVAMNNVDFGVAAIGATGAALVWTGGRPSRAGLGRLALEALAGILAAVALLTVLVLARTGGPPHFALLSAYAKIFAVAGFGMLPMKPVIGVSTVLYLTYVAAIGTATVRALRSDPDRLLTGLLAWSGIFGLGAGAYYMGRSHPEVLTNELPAWALAVTLLTLAAVRGLARSELRRVALPALACLFGFGILACSLAQTPLPWKQVERIEATEAQEGFDFQRADVVAFVKAHTHPGEHAMFLLQLSHRVADSAGIEDVTPYTSASIVTEEELEQSLKVLHDEGGHSVFVEAGTVAETVLALGRHGFRRVATTPSGYALWSNAARG